ncbi:alpha/beta fold hydrolase [Mycolicibacterium bacteremicum]|uniref:alpha/beta fold hydrolase n=1 Tax=Mycolicibacterium bacteremicum TaxID=564198 RepID=UPI0026E9C861|nr:alpha/beta hydrolase [Mycolicibacterium bacteremicum]
MPPTTVTVDGSAYAVEVAGPENAGVVVLIGTAALAPAAYEAVCHRLHTASLRTVVIAANPRLDAAAVIGIMDALDIRWSTLVGDRAGAEIAWQLAATRLDRFTGLVVIDRGHPRVADETGTIRDENCKPVEVATTVLVSNAKSAAVARATQRYVYGEFRLVELLGRRNAGESTAQLAAEIVMRTSTW